MADWMPPSPSPQSLFSSMLGDNIGSKAISESTCESESGFSFHGYAEHLACTNPDYRDELQAHSTIDQTSKFCAMSEQNISSRGGLLERMAARAGFNAPRLNTETIKSTDLSKNREVQSSYLTIPSGLSPTTLLESPVFLSNSLVGAHPSPTTGKFTFVPSGSSQNSGLFSESADKSNENIFGSMDGSSFAFRPAPSHYFGSSDRTSIPSIEVSVESENTMAPQMLEHSKAVAQNQQAETDTGGVNMSERRTTGAVSTVLEHSSPLDEQQDDEEADLRGGGDVIGGGAPAEDGYNWRKYGQKQVKGSEFPRSYYKCTNMNCPVKKKIERSLQGHITEIIYKGSHNHPKPPAHRRSALGSSGSIGNMQLENGEHAFTGGDGDQGWTNMQRGNIPSDWRHENVDVISSTMLGSQYGNGATSLPTQNNNQFESGDAADRSSTFSNDEDEDDRGTHGSASASVVYDGEGDESESKKRKVEAYSADMSGATRAIREPRVVVQTTSEVDILDDGYRWRKYGQKVVKGNPNPRSYYKCTSAGCSVRKHVERASHDLKSVITTYEGKHNHDVPAARNSSHLNSGNASTQSHVHRPEPSQLHNSMTHFDQNASFGSFGLPNRPHLIPPHDFGYGMNQRSLPNLTLSGWGGRNQSDLPFLQSQQQYLGQQRPINEMGFMLPKGEPKVEPISDSGLSLPNASSVYQQVMSRMPLGPHM